MPEKVQLGPQLISNRKNFIDDALKVASAETKKSIESFLGKGSNIEESVSEIFGYIEGLKSAAAGKEGENIKKEMDVAEKFVKISQLLINDPEVAKKITEENKEYAVQPTMCPQTYDSTSLTEMTHFVMGARGPASDSIPGAIFAQLTEIPRVEVYSVSRSTKEGEHVKADLMTKEGIDALLSKVSEVAKSGNEVMIHNLIGNHIDDARQLTQENYAPSKLFMEEIIAIVKKDSDFLENISVQFSSSNCTCDIKKYPTYGLNKIYQTALQEVFDDLKSVKTNAASATEALESLNKTFEAYKEGLENLRITKDTDIAEGKWKIGAKQGEQDRTLALGNIVEEIHEWRNKINESYHSKYGINLFSENEGEATISATSQTGSIFTGMVTVIGNFGDSGLLQGAGRMFESLLGKKNIQSGEIINLALKGVETFVGKVYKGDGTTATIAGGLYLASAVEHMKKLTRVIGEGKANPEGLTKEEDKPSGILRVLSNMPCCGSSSRGVG
ncbi:hypothetical protein N8772_01185 [Rickettsiales bacterium]|nr:hypothetical protein [Rickettsiales bacterium]